MHYSFHGIKKHKKDFRISTSTHCQHESLETWHSGITATFSRHLRYSRVIKTKFALGKESVVDGTAARHSIIQVDLKGETPSALWYMRFSRKLWIEWGWLQRPVRKSKSLHMGHGGEPPTFKRIHWRSQHVSCRCVSADPQLEKGGTRNRNQGLRTPRTRTSQQYERSKLSGSSVLWQRNSQVEKRGFPRPWWSSVHASLTAALSTSSGSVVCREISPRPVAASSSGLCRRPCFHACISPKGLRHFHAPTGG